MELTDFGYDSWFQDCLAGQQQFDHRIARVSAFGKFIKLAKTQFIK